ncbi:MAG: hypothetical protein QNJ34_09125 [Xenococcaceae cyanobacterium MO_188.B29]|nr:hypothetical protein [Xenococcaceae cyanobacterium MO_188.B29]
MERLIGIAIGVSWHCAIAPLRLMACKKIEKRANLLKKTKP